MKQRIRSNLGKKTVDTLTLNDLNYIQTHYYNLFINDTVDKSGKVRPATLVKRLKNAFPITSDNGKAELSFVQHSLQEPICSEEICRDFSLSYSYSLWITADYKIYSLNAENNKTKLVKTSRKKIFLGEIPKMTTKGTFIINGHEKVVIAQIGRCSGIMFTKDYDHDSALACRFMPQRGSWLELIVNKSSPDAPELLMARIDRKKKIPLTILLEALGYSLKDAIQQCSKPLSITLQEDSFYFNKTNFKGDVSLPLNIYDEKGDILVKSHEIINQDHIKLIKNNLRLVTYPKHYLTGYRLYDEITEGNEILGKTGELLTTALLSKLPNNKQLTVTHGSSNWLIDTSKLHEDIDTPEKLTRYIYLNCAQDSVYNLDYSTKETAASIIAKLFFDPQNYDLSEIGRFKINKVLGSTSQENFLQPADIINAIKQLEWLYYTEQSLEDMDSLSNRRLRTVDEQLDNILSLGLYRIQKHVYDVINSNDYENYTARDLLNINVIDASMREFFNKGELCQFMDQDNALSEVTHKRRITALGTGGISRDRAGIEIRDVNTTYYGRICAVETPEGENIGLISSLTCYAAVNQYGFITTPYRRVIKGQVSKEIVWLTADEEQNYKFSHAAITLDQEGNILDTKVACRYNGEIRTVKREEIDFIDVSHKQMISASAALIPFLEHNVADRALMGSNMQRQAVPLLIPQAPLVGTGMEATVAKDSQSCVLANNPGSVVSVNTEHIAVEVSRNPTRLLDFYPLDRFSSSNKNTLINQRPIVQLGDTIALNSVLADGACTDKGELAIGCNINVAFIPLQGYNFEDSIIVSEAILAQETFTSIHIEEYICTVRETTLGSEEVTADVPNGNAISLAKLDKNGVILVGQSVNPGDILVGKITPKAEEKSTPEDRLLKAIFGDRSSNIYDSSLRVPQNVSGVVTKVTRINSHTLTCLGKQNKSSKSQREAILRVLRTSLGNELPDTVTESKLLTSLKKLNVHTAVKKNILNRAIAQLEELELTNQHSTKQQLNSNIKNSLLNGLIEIIKVEIAIQQHLQPGDKLTGRHGNKGVVSRILRREDMPFTSEGEVVDIVLTPIGVPSRMNIGQIFEVALGLIARKLGDKVNELLRMAGTPEQVRALLTRIYHDYLGQDYNLASLSDYEIMLLAQDVKHGVYVAAEVFNSIKEKDLTELLVKCGCKATGKVQLYDGCTGRAFDNESVMGYMYFLKLDHLIDNKMHARSTGPYSIITQQPLGGRAQDGGQRFGEMEAWALQGYGASHLLREMLTVKSDDVLGRNEMYNNIIFGRTETNQNLPESFNVLKQELRALGLNLEVNTDSSEKKN